MRFEIHYGFTQKDINDNIGILGEFNLYNMKVEACQVKETSNKHT